MELKIDQKVMGKLRSKGYDINEMEEVIREELKEYDFEGSPLFDLFFEYNGEKTHAQGKLIEGVAHCYGVGTNLKIIEI